MNREGDILYVVLDLLYHCISFYNGEFGHYPSEKEDQQYFRGLWLPQVPEDTFLGPLH